jgi:hypothetical protein
VQILVYFYIFRETEAMKKDEFSNLYFVQNGEFPNFSLQQALGCPYYREPF